MNAATIVSMVKEIAIYENLKPVDVAHMQRYFLTLYTPMPQREIADLLCCERSTICNSVKKMQKVPYRRVVSKIKSMITHSERGGERGYTWEPKGIKPI